MEAAAGGERPVGRELVIGIASQAEAGMRYICHVSLV